MTYYAVRDIKRKPREAVTLAAVMSAIMLTLILLMLWIEADWRAKVMPLCEDNYHFEIEGLTASEKSYIKSLDWCYDTYEVTDMWGDSSFRVRIKWEYLEDDYTECIKEVYEFFDLQNRDPYKKTYDYWYKKLYDNYSNAYNSNGIEGFLISAQYINSSPKQAADIAAARNVFTEMENRSFCVLTTQNYLLMPDNLITLLLFTVFLGAVIFILTNERYRRNLSEMGTLRALGFAKWQMYGYYTVKGILLSLAAVIPASVTAFLLVSVYGLLTKNMPDSEKVYFRIGETLPVFNLFMAFVFLFAAVVLSNIIVCHKYRGYSAMDGLRGRETLEIDYVSETSSVFERSESELSYAALYTSRTKKRIVNNALSVAVMVPLPIYYFSMINESAKVFYPLEMALTVFQAVLLTLTAVFVISLSEIYTVRGRRGELSMLRALGMSKSKIYRTVLCGSLIESGIATLTSAVFSSAVMLYMAKSMSTVYNDPDRMKVAMGGVLEFTLSTVFDAFLLIPIAALFVFTSKLLGMYIGINIYTRGSITEGIRKTD